MHVLHLPASFLPWRLGGKEVYVARLVEALQEMGVAGSVAFHSDPINGEPVGTHEGDVPVHVLPPLAFENARAAFAHLPKSLPGFDRLLSDVQPDVVHLHDFSTGVTLEHLRAIKSSGVPVVMTYHSPGQSCMQGSLLRGGEVVCDGRILLERCTRCRLAVSGAPKWMARPMAKLLPPLFLGDGSGTQRALSMKATTTAFVQSWSEMVGLVDGFLVFGDWAGKLALENGFPTERIHVVRPGAPVGTAPDPAPRRGVLRLAFVGRCDFTKGVHVLVDAILGIPHAELEVNLFGPYWDSSYGRDLTTRMSGDGRFIGPELLDPDALLSRLQTLDALVVPSIWLETGPLVVLEALSQGTPVIGSELGGIAELIGDGGDGYLFPPGDSRALGTLIERLARDPDQVRALRPRASRTFAQVATEVGNIYKEVLSSKQHR